MALGEIAATAALGIGRFLAGVVIEFCIQGTGYVLLRLFRSPRAQSDTACLMAGLAFLALTLVGLFAVLMSTGS